MFISSICYSQTWETKTVTTEEGRRTFTVRTDIYEIYQHSFHIVTNRNARGIQEIWKIERWSVFCSIENKWSEWETISEDPVDMFYNNNALISFVRMIREYDFVVDDFGEKYLSIWIQNRGRDYWWENRSYIITQRILYKIR